MKFCPFSSGISFAPNRRRSLSMAFVFSDKPLFASTWWYSKTCIFSSFSSFSSSSRKKEKGCMSVKQLCFYHIIGEEKQTKEQKMDPNTRRSLKTLSRRLRRIIIIRVVLKKSPHINAHLADRTRERVFHFLCVVRVPRTRRLFVSHIRLESFFLSFPNSFRKP